MEAKKYCRGEHPPDGGDDSDDEDVCDISFPIVDNSLTTEMKNDVVDDQHQPMTKESVGGDTYLDGHSNSTAAAAGQYKSDIDEDAIIRCFDISVNSHINRSSIAIFEHIIPTSKKKSNRNNGDDAVTKSEQHIRKRTKDEIGLSSKRQQPDVATEQQQQQQSKKMKSDDKSPPGTLPLPNWAKNIP